MTLIVSAILAMGLVLVGFFLPVPYVRLTPGPVDNTLGAHGGTPLIAIPGHATTPTTGALYLVTVDEYGGARKNLSIGYLLLGWWRSSEAVVPRRLLYAPSTTAKQAQRESEIQMDTSQENAKVAALRYLGYPLKPGVEIVAVEASSSAKDSIELGDVITGVDSTSVTNSDQLVAVLKKHHAGDRVVLHVDRAGKAVDIPVVLGPPAPGGTAPTIGVQVMDSYTKPFQIDIHLGNVGGPSAGLAFALGIVDKLSDGQLTGGKTIAGTGEISPDGSISAIGGVRQKMVAAKGAGSTIFLLPKSNCAEAMKGVPRGLRLVPVTTLSGAVGDLKKLAAGDPNVPSCPSS